MRSTSTLLLISLVCCWTPSAPAKDEPDQSPQPLFLAPGFQPSEVDAICLAPVADLRLDTSDAQLLTGARPPRPPALARAFGAITLSSVDADLAAIANTYGHSTTNCKPPGGTEDDLNLPLAASWLSNLDFAGSRWLLFVGVEQTSTKFHNAFNPLRIINPAANRMESGWAVVSAYLFDKQPQPRLVWHDRKIGRDNGIMELYGKRDTQKAYEAEISIRLAEQSLLSAFYKQAGNRKNAKPLSGRNLKLRNELNRREPFTVSCDALWTAIDNTLKTNPKQYEIVKLYDYAKMAVFAVGGGEESDKRVDYLTLQAVPNGCTEHFVEDYLGMKSTTGLKALRNGYRLSYHDIEHFNKLVYASLP